MSTELVTITIDGKEVRAPKGMLLVEAAKLINLEIPVFCYHPKLKSVGACRMCLVQIEKMPRLQTACTTPISDGMAVHFNVPDVIFAQNGVIEYLLENHPLDCPVCDKGGECPLQDNTMKFGRGASRLTEDKTRKDKAFPLSDRIVLDKERCILCYRCTRFQAEIPGDEAIVAINRGGLSEVGVLDGETFDSIFSGNTIELCPVGALTSRQYRFKARPWDLRRTPGTCSGCAVGCNVEIHARDGRILRLVSRENPEVDDSWLCDYGRFDTLPAVPENRVRQPLVRRGAELAPASFEEAIARAAELLNDPNGGTLLSPTLSNEGIFAFNDVLRPRLGAGHRAAFWPSGGTPWPLRGTITDVAASKTIVLVGLDAWHDLPVLALWIRRAVVHNGANLVVVGATNGLYRDTAAWLRAERGAEAGVVEQLLAALAGAGEGIRGVVGKVTGAAPSAEVRHAAGLLSAAPVTLLAGPHLAADAAALALVQRLADTLGAGNAGGLVGAPALAANARGAQELAPDLALADPGGVAAAGTLLCVGDEAWTELPAARLILATPVQPNHTDKVEVLLPLSHIYEQAGSITNLEGRVQQLGAGGGAPPQARMDWELLIHLANQLGATLRPDLFRVRAALAGAHPDLGATLSGGLPPRGRIIRPLVGAAQ